MRPFYLFAAAFLSTLILFASCRKQSAGDVSLSTADSLAQSQYNVYRSAAASETGTIVVAPNGGQYDSSTLMIMDGEGHVKAMQHQPASVLNFRRWIINGQTRYAWFLYDQSLFDATAGAFEPGYELIADENLHQINRINFLPSATIPDVSHQNLDGHDFLLLSESHYIAMAYVKRIVHNLPASLGTNGDAFVATPVIQEVENGQIIWQWEASNYPEFYSTSVEGNNYADMSTPQDYMHMNSMTIDSADGNLICSFRNCDQVIKIRRNTGEIIWRLGGSNSDFPLTADMVFLRQHNATLTDDDHTLLLFDNGEISQRPYSRIMEFQLDEEAHKIYGYRAFTIPEPYTRFMGSVQKMGKHYFIGGGSANYVVDVNYLTGEKTLRAQLQPFYIPRLQVLGQAGISLYAGLFIYSACQCPLAKGCSEPWCVGVPVRLSDLSLGQFS